MVKSASFLLGLAALCAAPAAADDKPDADLGANAALKYWQAFSTLPKLDEGFSSQDARTAPLDDKTKELVAGAAYSLQEMHYAAALPRCVWGASLEEDGIRTRLPYLQGARNLAALAVLRMRIRFANGQTTDALNDAVDALTMGRHASRDGTLIAVLVGIAVDQLVTDALAEHLPELDKATLKQLSARLDAMPPAQSWADAMWTGEEHAGLDWFIRQVKQTKDKDQLLKLLAEVADGPDKGKELLDACGGTAEGVLKYAEETRPLYAAVVKKKDLPPDKFEAETEAMLQKEAKSNPIFKLFFPSVSKVHRADARYQARQALRKAAFAILIDGPDAVKAQRDPYGDGPFEYVPFDGGFELRSQLKQQDKPISLTVGRRKDKEK
ncbi:MAG TPA: hypothetical protein VMS17_20665 [Gemmataceae bacterium]|nr:hypothetical protein [Gemmataceae bacterium]